MSPPLLEARRLGFDRAGRAVVDDVSLALEPGDLLAVVGPNGAGKSTLLALLSGALAPSRGAVLIEGAPLAALPGRRLAAKRAAMTQGPRVGLPFTAREVVGLGAEGVGRGLDRAARARLAALALEEAGAAGLAARPVSELSGGEARRVHFARALAQLAAGRTQEARQLLLLDEPTAGLDPRHQLLLLERAAALAAGGRAVVVVLHDLAQAAALPGRALVLERGRVAALGPAAAALGPGPLEAVFGVRRAPGGAWALAGR